MVLDACGAGALLRRRGLQRRRRQHPGHWELMGVVSLRPLPTYPNGFPGHGSRRHDGPMADVGASVLMWLTGRRAELPGAPFPGSARGSAAVSDPQEGAGA